MSHSCECGCGKRVFKEGIRFLFGHRSRIDNVAKRPDVRKKLSISNSGPNHSDQNSSNWKGGKSGYYHTKARKLFVKHNCELCNLSNEESIQNYNERLSMHCTGVPKDYTLMSTENWMTVCVECHHKKLDGNGYARSYKDGQETSKSRNAL
jgi:hypothetical protein